MHGQGPTYNSYSQFSRFPACSFDWGSDGYGGCSNNGGELLYLTAQSKEHGLIVARGNFSTSLYASLSRTQIDFGGPSTFGLEIARVDAAYSRDPKTQLARNSDSGSSFSLGPMIERGSFNYRWPLNEYYLDLHPDLCNPQSNGPGPAGNNATGQGEGSGSGVTGQTGCLHDGAGHVGTCQMLSYAENGTFYQILRIEEGGHTDHAENVDGVSRSCRCFPSSSQVVLTMGGPVWFRAFDPQDRVGDDNLSKKDRVCSTANVSNPVRIADLPLQMNMETEVEDISDLVSQTSNSNQLPPNSVPHASNSTAAVGPSVTFQNIVYSGPSSTATRGSNPSPPPSPGSDNNPDTGHYQNIRLWNEKRRIGLAIQVHQLGPDGRFKPVPLPLKPSLTAADSGTEEAQQRSKTTAYNAVVPLEDDDSDGQEHRAATFLARIQFFEEKKDGGKKWPPLPSSEDVYAHVGASPSVPNATGAMWETVFTERQMKLDHTSDLDLAEVSLVGRSLEKILQVDVVPAHFGGNGEDDEVLAKMKESQAKSMKKHQGKCKFLPKTTTTKTSQETALLSNIFLLPNVNLKSMLWVLSLRKT